MSKAQPRLDTVMAFYLIAGRKTASQSLKNIPPTDFLAQKKAFPRLNDAAKLLKVVALIWSGPTPVSEPAQNPPNAKG